MKYFTSLLLLILLLVGGAFTGFVYLRAGSVTTKFFEKNAPVITSVDQIGLGLEPRAVAIDISDSDTGLEDVVVRLEQDGHAHELLKQHSPAKTFTNSLSVTINAKELGLKENTPAHIIVNAFDRSFWVNTTQKIIPITIKYSRPRGEVLTGQQNIALGGVEPVFYRIKGAEVSPNGLAATGVQVGDHIFPGYPASQLDTRFERFPDVYFSLFSLPYNFNKATDKVQIFISDIVGNTTNIAFNYLIIPRKYQTVDMKLTDTFLQKIFDELLPPYFEISKEKPFLPAFDVPSMSTEEKIKAFKIINESYRSLLLTKMAEIVKKSEPRQFWQGVWQRPMRAAPTSTFAETRNYQYEGGFASQSLHAGVDLADTTNAPVKPAAAGKILFADFFGIYGNAVIIDHGFGLTTVYGHLSSILVNVGDAVTTETVIGRTGSTGLAGGDHLHYEVRLAGTPVHPIEWWDGTWIHQHIENKTTSVFDSLTAGTEQQQ